MNRGARPDTVNRTIKLRLLVRPTVPVSTAIMNEHMKILIRLMIANASIIICVGIASLLPGLWMGISGRDFRPQAFNATILILATSVIMRYKLKWPILHMIFYLIPTQFIVLLCTSYFSGYTVFQLLCSPDLFQDFIQWLLLVDLFIATPWIMGVFIGSFMLKIKDKKM